MNQVQEQQANEVTYRQKKLDRDFPVKDIKERFAICSKHFII
jgi:hypothetical protein